MTFDILLAYVHDSLGTYQVTVEASGICDAIGQALEMAKHETGLHEWYVLFPSGHNSVFSLTVC